MKMNIARTSQDTLNHESTIGAFELSDAELATIQGACGGDDDCGYRHSCGLGLIHVGVVVNVGLVGDLVPSLGCL